MNKALILSVCLSPSIELDNKTNLFATPCKISLMRHQDIVRSPYYKTQYRRMDRWEVI